MSTTKSQSGWREATLGEVAVLNYGKSLQSEKRIAGSVPVYGSSGITGWNNEALVKERGIIIGRKGTVGAIYKSETPFYPIDTVFYITQKDTQCDLDFLYNLLLSLGLNEMNSDSAVPGLNRNNAYTRSILLPELCEQRAIAAVLSSLDDKIELLHTQNKTLEAIAQQLFHEWFVEFNFPNENGHPYKKSGGKMVDGELGEMPEGWKIKRLSEIADVTIGRTPPRKESEWFSGNSSDKKWISIKDLGASGMFVDTTSEYLTATAVERFRVPLIPKGTVVVSFKLTVGRVAIVSEDMYSNEAIAHIKTHLLPTEYTYLFFKNFNYDSLGSTSSIATAVNSESIRQIRVLIPSDSVLRLFALVADALFEKIALNTQTIKTLSTLRDSLLPRMMSGEVRVKNVS
ncbi:restriction endonuclease subunit S [Candidatus Uhrbacteria bacterium]|nr:restriction endonuclease subunit S [Candidatus Uhrbacteria bacterium]